MSTLYRVEVDGKDSRVYLDNGQRIDMPSSLIAAAPDLLAAIKAVVAIADRKTDEFDAARAAIAKAEGKS